MRLTLDTGKKKDLTASEVKTLDSLLRSRIPELVSWSYTHETGELILDFGEAEDSRLLAKIQDWTSKAEARAVKRLEFLEMVKEWVK